MTASELLRQARALIADERNWWDGKHTWLPHTDRRCAVQALAWSGWFSSANRRQAFLCLEEAVGGWPARFNDAHTHPEVLAAFDRAIALAERQEAAT